MIRSTLPKDLTLSTLLKGGVEHETDSPARCGFGPQTWQIPVRSHNSVQRPCDENVRETNSGQIRPVSRRTPQNSLRLDPPQRKEKV